MPGKAFAKGIDRTGTDIPEHNAHGSQNEGIASNGIAERVGRLKDISDNLCHIRNRSRGNHFLLGRQYTH